MANSWVFRHWPKDLLVVYPIRSLYDISSISLLHSIISYSIHQNISYPPGYHHVSWWMLKSQRNCHFSLGYRIQDTCWRVHHRIQDICWYVAILSPVHQDVFNTNRGVGLSSIATPKKGRQIKSSQNNGTLHLCFFSGCFIKYRNIIYI